MFDMPLLSPLHFSVSWLCFFFLCETKQKQKLEQTCIKIEFFFFVCAKSGENCLNTRDLAQQEQKLKLFSV